RLAPEAAAAIRSEAARAYPAEGCGALLGPADAAVSEVLPLTNQEASSPRTRFTVSPLDYLAVEGRADARGLKLLGFWHSHPDHPACPSPTDRAHAWPGLLTLVIGVERGDPGEMTAWDVPGHEEPFRQLELEISPRKEPT
ncbi:MAG TPA: M67 family metallopeptidase, partial [Vicinamibacteria bacterium]|nr:M67 family metallopeptidase [Vicinamibacteria bacterium]